MKLGLELVATHPVTLRLGTFFETWIALPPGMLRRSLGRDEYHLSLLIEAGGRLAATGRTHICQVDLADAGLGENGARGATLLPAEPEPGQPVIWSIRTNLFLSLPALTAGARLRLLRDGAPPAEVSLTDERLTVDEVAPGRYVVEMGELLASD